LEKENLEPTWILLTHSHWDHVGGVEKLCDLYPHLRVAVHVLEAHRLSPKLIQKLGDRLHTIRATADQPEKLEPSAPEFEITALHTPGHSAGEICFYLKSAPGRFLFSGDTLFIRDCGNTSQETGDTAAMFETLQRIKHLPPDTVILPGHHYFKGKTAATLAEEVQLSPPLQCRSVAELEALP
jgi:glyoxylase-like metal-dependent hydrolase (beta-lactamase superfamily II)